MINSWCKPFWSCAAGDAGCCCCCFSCCWCCRGAASGLLIIAARFAAGCCQAGAKLLLNCCYSGLLPWSAAKLLLDCCYIPPTLLLGWCWPAAGLSGPVLNFCCTASGKRLLDSAKQLLGSKVLPQHMTRYGTRYSTRLQRRWQCTRVWLHAFYISGRAPLLGPPLAQDFVAKLISQRPQDRLSHSVLAAVLSRWRLLAMGLAISRFRTDGFRNLPHWEWSWFKVRLLVQVNLLGQTLWKAVRDFKPHRRWSSILFQDVGAQQAGHQWIFKQIWQMLLKNRFNWFFQSSRFRFDPWIDFSTAPWGQIRAHPLIKSLAELPSLEAPSSLVEQWVEESVSDRTSRQSWKEKGAALERFESVNVRAQLD